MPVVIKTNSKLCCTLKCFHLKFLQDFSQWAGYLEVFPFQCLYKFIDCAQFLSEGRCKSHPNDVWNWFVRASAKGWFACTGLIRGTVQCSVWFLRHMFLQLGKNRVKWWPKHWAGLGNGAVHCVVVDTGEDPICRCGLSFMNIGVKNMHMYLVWSVSWLDAAPMASPIYLFTGQRWRQPFWNIPTLQAWVGFIGHWCLVCPLRGQARLLGAKAGDRRDWRQSVFLQSQGKLCVSNRCCGPCHEQEINSDLPAPSWTWNQPSFLLLW